MIRATVDTRQVIQLLNGAVQQMPYAVSVGLNNTAQEIRRAEVEEMQKCIDRPTRFTLNSLQVTPATKTSLVATVGLKKMEKRSTHYLEPLIVGGPRHMKGFERAFGKKWLLPGKAMTLDQYGNMPRTLIIQLLAYFQQFGEVGYKSNMTADKRARMAKIKRMQDGKALTKRQLAKDAKAGYLTIAGKVYFLSLGRGVMGRRGEQHLMGGIYQKSGTHGVKLTPIMIQGERPSYTKRFDYFGVAQRTIDKSLQANIRAAVSQALKTAR